MSDRPLADDVWRAMATVVFDHRDDWRRSVVERTGLPFSRIRLLRRLVRRSMTAKELGEAAAMDAPATSVAVSDLEDRGLVVRTADPTNRRCKVISVTDAGRRLVARIDDVDDPAPAPLAELSAAELRTLRTILAKVSSD